MLDREKGFTFIELIAILVIVSILTATLVSGSQPSTSFQLQSSRDQVITAFFAAQQRAMTQTRAVSVVISAPNTVDIREDVGGVATSLAIGGTQYPIALLPSQTLTPGVFLFDRLGRTSSSRLTLNQGTNSVDITISATGFVF